MMKLSLVKGVAKSTNEIKNDYIYFCFEGIKVDGHDFIEKAFSKGAIYVVGTKNINHENNHQSIQYHLKKEYSSG